MSDTLEVRNKNNELVMKLYNYKHYNHDGYRLYVVDKSGKRTSYNVKDMIVKEI